MDTNPVDRAIELAGSAAALGRLCNQKPQAVTRWRRTGKVPAAHCLAIETATGVSRHDLRPDVFGPPPSEQGREAA